MPVSIKSLPVVRLDYTHRGPGLHTGLTQLHGMLETEGGRTGHVLVQVVVKGATVPTVLARSDLYVLGIECAGTWFRFDDADWPFSEGVAKLGYDGQYRSLGGLAGSLTAGAIEDIAYLANIGDRQRWKDALRTLLVVVAECSRLIPVQMDVLGLLNGIIVAVPLAKAAPYIRNWSKASRGMDMSREVQPGLRVGFRDPTIIKALT